MTPRGDSLGLGVSMRPASHELLSVLELPRDNCLAGARQNVRRSDFSFSKSWAAVQGVGFWAEGSGFMGPCAEDYTGLGRMGGIAVLMNIHSNCGQQHGPFRSSVSNLACA